LTLWSNLANNFPSMLVGDSNRLRQILLNLLSNAFKFTKQGFVSLTVACVDSSNVNKRLRFEVTDSGTGIDPCEHMIVIQKYRQANATVARHYGGTGLGLSICKSLTKFMGGTIGIVNQKGKGTTVFWKFPFSYQTQ
jgi:signal transduction histidine kinase